MADDLTDEQVRAYRLADNKVSEFSEWEDSLLSEELDSIFDIDMSVFGFEEMEDELPDEIIEDEAPDVNDNKEPKTKLGDIYQLGRHYLMCGDSTDASSIELLMQGEKADMVFADPPYGYEYVSNHQSKYEMLKNDDTICDYISACKAALNENTAIYSFCGWQSLKEWLGYFGNSELNLKNVIVWKKNNWSMGDLKGAYAGQYEIILYLAQGKVELRGRRDTDIWEFDREPPKLHPTMKPIELIAYALKKSSDKGDIVLDPFGGSGSTLIACEQTGRQCYMMELDSRYCDVIIERWENYTGQKAHKL